MYRFCAKDSLYLEIHVGGISRGHNFLAWDFQSGGGERKFGKHSIWGQEITIRDSK